MAGTRTPKVALGTLKPGQTQVRHATITPPGAGQTGLQAVLDGSGGAHQTSFLAAEPRDGGYVTASSFDGLADAALSRDLATQQLTKQQYRQKYHQLHGVPGFTRSSLRIDTGGKQPSTASPDLASTSTVEGTVIYYDKKNTARAVRHGWVGVQDVETGILEASGRTGDDGGFSLTFTPDGCSTTEYEIVARTDDGYGSISYATGGEPYQVTSENTVVPCAGNTYLGVDLDIPNDDNFGKAFALLDAVDTIGGYYAGIRQSSWPATLKIKYPGDSEYTAADGDHPITVPGNSVQCDDGACPEEAFDWDALAHESGHVVAMSAGFSGDVDTSGGHDICANAWGQEVSSKSDAVRLAWEEGFPTFYGVSLLQDSTVPQGIPDVEDGHYIDNGGTKFYDFQYSLDDNGGDYGNITCRPSGDDSEMAVQRALWEFRDGSADSYSGGLGWPLSRFLSAFESAQPHTFTAAYSALIQGSDDATVQKARTTLTALGFAPKVTRASAGADGAGATANWTRGGDSGYVDNVNHNGTAHPNDSFTVQFVDTDTGSVIVQHATSDTGYTASASEQSQIAGHAHVSVDVLGEQSTSPVSGPFGSTRKALSVWSATPDSGLNAMWNGYGNNADCDDWGGGDATNSVALPDGERAWFFSDTYLGSPAARKSLWYSSGIHNSIVTQSGSSLTKTITGGNTCQETNQNLDFWDRYAKTPANAPDSGGFYWTGDQRLVGSTVVKFYYHGHATTTSDGGSSFTIDYPAVASIPASSLENDSALTITPQSFTCGPSGIIWGTAMVEWNGDLYVYGWRQSGNSDNVYVAKTTDGNLADPSSWLVYDGGGSSPAWAGCGNDTATALPISGTSGFSVSTINGGLWLTQFDYTNGQLNAEGAIGAHPASTPWGFTDTSIPLYYPPTGYVSYPYYYQDYEARIQPGLGGSDHVVLSYNVNTSAVDTGCVSANAHDASIYRPRFVDVPTTAFNSADATPTLAAKSTADKTTTGGGADTNAPHIGGFRGDWPVIGPLHKSAPGSVVKPTKPNPKPTSKPASKPTAGPATTSQHTGQNDAVRTGPASPDDSGGIDGSTDWFKLQLGGTCPTIPAPSAPTTFVNPDGTVDMAWPSVGTDVWYYVYTCDATRNPCPSGETTSPWVNAWSTPDGGLWSPQPAATIAPAVAASTDGYNASGDTFSIYLQAFGAGNSTVTADSPITSVVDTIQPPAQVTGLTVTSSPGPTGTIDHLTWNQVTYPSTSVYYAVHYCDTAAMDCAGLDPTQWPTNGLQTATTTDLVRPDGNTTEYCVQASNLGGNGPCSDIAWTS